MNNSALLFHIGLGVLVLVLWILLTGSLLPDELFIGALVSIGVSLATPRSDIFSGFKLSAQAPMALVRYVIHFFMALVKANLDMARRILTPALPLNPSVVEIKTELQSDLGKLLLANSITLTPGTLTVDVKNERMLVHWVDCQSGTDLDATTRVIASGFEAHIKGFLK